MKKLILLIAISLTHSLASACDEKTAQTYDMQVTDKGFEPATINATSSKCTLLKITRKVDATCATSIQIPDKKIKKDLPLNQLVTLDLGVLKKGEIRFGCAEDMMISGKIIVK